MTISLITTTYNSEQTLKNTFESVLHQTYKDIEYIVVDGNSHDSTLNIIKEYEPLFEGRMHWISESDKGIYDAMNKGIRMATGALVGFINSDDFLSAPDVVEKQIELLENAKADAVYADVCYVDFNDTNKIYRYYSSSNFRRWKIKIGLIPAHPTFYCKKEIYNKLGLFDINYGIAADFECLLRFIYINNIKTVYNPIQVVTMRTGGISSSGIQSWKQIMQEHLEAFKEHGIYTNVFFLSLRYFGKVTDLIKGKIERKKSSIISKNDSKK